MIFKLEFPDKTEYCQAQDILHCLQAYELDYEGFRDIKSIAEISDEESKEIQLRNDEYDPDIPGEFPEFISLFDSAVGDDFAIIGSSEW